jgi:hypothetical protein
LKGEWAAARDILRKVEGVKGSTDYPTNNILAVMEESHYVAGKDWKGYRELTEK